MEMTDGQTEQIRQIRGRDGTTPNEFLGSRLLAAGKGVLAFLPRCFLFWATLLQSQQAFGFPAARFL
jgi:hypothetical protein